MTENLPSRAVRGDVVPLLSPRLRTALIDLEPSRHGVAGEDPGLVLAPRGVAASAREEAARLLAEMQRTRTIDREAMAAWLDPILAARLPNAPVDGDSVKGAIIAAALVTRHLPAAVLTDETMIAALSTWKWWPAPAEIRELLDRAAEPWITRVAQLRAIVAAPVRREEWAEPSDAYQPPPYAPPPATAAGRVRPPQDPPRHLDPKLLRKFRDGNPIVQAARKDGGRDG